MKLSNVKGTKDYLPAEQIIRERIISALTEVFQLYGFCPLDTPALEYFELLSAKYAGGAEILKETFTLNDRKDRQLGLRYDLTVPFSRVIASNPQLKLPFKRYQISKVWRNGPIGLGRYREFQQCDIDVVGSKNMKADAEILAVASDVFKKLDLDAVIKVNSRKILNAILDKLEISNIEDAILVIDKIEKLNKDEILEEFKQKGISSITAEKIIDFFTKIKGKDAEKLQQLEKTLTSEEGKQGIKEIRELFIYLKSYKINAAFEPSLARGLSFYTGTVFETFLNKSNIKSAVASGGRYDKIIGKLLDSKQEYPAVGISFGLDRIYDALLDAKLVESRATNTEVYIIPINIDNEAIEIIQKIRKAGINAETDIIGRGLSKNLDYANTMKIPFVIFIGKQEIENNKLKLRNMNTGEENMLPIEKIIEALKSAPTAK